MQSTALQFSLPTFDELRMTASRPRHIGEGKTRIMNVIAAVPALNLLKVAAYCRVSTDHDDQPERCPDGSYDLRRRVGCGKQPVCGQERQELQHHPDIPGRRGGREAQEGVIGELL